MPRADPMREGERIMVICNACRYCEGYCAVFPAMEQRRTFTAGDLSYLANLCHNCSECLYACQYAPPHEFSVNVPRTLAQIRLQSYEGYAWPQAFATLFERHSVPMSLALSAGLTLFMLAVALVLGGGSLEEPARGGDFYQVLPHHLLVALFGGVFGFASIALGTGVVRFWREVKTEPSALAWPRALAHALRDALTLKYLHGDGADCTYAGEEARSPWRRWFHHCTSYGFVLCFAATSVAAVYHVGFGWRAPYAYSSLPVVLGTAGGIGLVIGPAGLFWLERRRDRATADPAQEGLDRSFVVLLLLSSVTGLLLLVLRETAVMAALLIVHLGVILALFLTLPYGKFVHGLYRLAALTKYALECGRTPTQ
jgi:citrate/tricarballylate utilization protein